MTNRFPLIVDSVSQTIKELPIGDNLDLTGSGIAGGTIDGTVIGGSTPAAGTFTSADLAAIAETKAVTAVDVFVYDTSKDSDGGAWRKRTQHTSWYNETLNTATRGSRREFPAVAVIVAESNKVTIYDGDDPSLPMWMVFEASTDVDMLYGAFSASLTSIVMRNAVLVTGANPYALNIISFLAETGRYVNSGTSYLYKGTIAERNDNKNIFQDGFYDPIVNSAVNDVAMTVLPDAPIDPATGLPVPTIAVATNGGVSVIKDDGNIWDLTYLSGSTESELVEFDSNGGIYWGGYSPFSNSSIYLYWNKALPTADDATAPDAVYASNQNTAIADLVTKLGNFGYNSLAVSDVIAAGASNGLFLIDQKDDSPADGMTLQMTSSFNTGWMNGDIKGAFLSDTDDTDLVATDTISDRSVNGLTLTLGDSCTVAAVATGADLVGYTFASSETVTLGTDISSTGALIWWEEVSGIWHCYVNDLSGGTDYDNGASGTAGTGLTISGTTLTFAASKKMALARATATIPTADQIKKIYEDEKVLFQENSQATLYGASDAVTALAHDSELGLLHVGTSAGRSVFSGLRRVSNTTTAVGTAISASNGLVVEE